MRFVAVIYDDEGKILGQQSNATELALQGKNYVKHSIDGNLEEYYVANGEVREKGTKPSEGHVFNYSTGQWKLDIELARSEKWKAIKAERQVRELSTFDWNTHIFQCDEVSQMRIQSAVQAAILDDSLSMVWTLADNTAQTFTASELKQIGQALSNHVKECHDRGRILRAQIDAATTQEELEAIVW